MSLIYSYWELAWTSHKLKKSFLAKTLKVLIKSKYEFSFGCKWCFKMYTRYINYSKLPFLIKFLLFLFLFFLKGRPKRAPMVTAYEWVPILNFRIGAGLWWYTHFTCWRNTWLWLSKVESEEINDSSPSETRTTDPLHYRPTLNKVSYSAVLFAMKTIATVKTLDVFFLHLTILIHYLSTREIIASGIIRLLKDSVMF